MTASSGELLYRRAHLLLWISMVFLLVGIGLGMAWDRAYHTRFPFDSFLSPPHLFIYTMCGIATFFVGWLCLDRRTRLAFGRPIRLPLLGWEISGAQVLYAGGLATVGFAGMVLDNIWHSSFGLDETGWSFPHSMLGWGLLVTALGFVACRLGLRPHRPFAWYTLWVMGWLVVAFSAAPFLGPIGKNPTPSTVRAVASIPILSVEPEAQHTFRIYLRWNLNGRTAPTATISPVSV